MRRQGLQWIAWAAIVLIVITGAGIYAATEIRATASQPRPDQLTEASQALYRSAAEGNRQVVYQQVQQLRQKAAHPQIRSKGQAEGWLEVDVMLAELTTGLQGVSSTHELRVASARLSLAFDALNGGHEALWRSYYPLIRDDVNRLNKAWHRQTSDYASAALAVTRGMREHYRMIEVAALFQQQPEMVRELDASIDHIAVQLASAEQDQMRYASVSRSIQSLAYAVDRLFLTPADTVADPVIFIDKGKMPLRFALIMAVLIIAVLLYAGWQRFKYDRDRFTRV